MNKENGDFIKEVSMIKNCSLDYIQYIKSMVMIVHIQIE